MKCPQCYTVNAPAATECERCGVQFRDIGRTQAALDFSLLCGWSDRGQQCGSRWVINRGAKGYCREHDMRLCKEVPDGVGNYPVPKTARSLHMRQWDDWFDGWKRNRDRKPLPNPVEDYADLVEEVQI